MKTASHGFARPLVFALIAVVLLAGLSGAGVWYLSETSLEMQTETVLSNVKRAMLTCYAVEGAYPMTIDELVENYGLHYNKERFIVFYDAFASNVMPEVRVNVRGRGEE